MSLVGLKFDENAWYFGNCWMMGDMTRFCYHEYVYLEKKIYW